MGFIPHVSYRFSPLLSYVFQTKLNFYRAWRFGYPNEFVPFAMDNTGMLSKSSLRFLSRMRNHAKRLDRFRGLTRFWEAMSIGLAKGSAHGFALMSRGVGVKKVRVVNGWCRVVNGWCPLSWDVTRWVGSQKKEEFVAKSTTCRVVDNILNQLSS